MEPIIREAVEGDLPAVCDIAAAAWQPIYAEFRRRLGDEIFDRLYHDWEPRKRNDVRQAFERHPGCMLVTQVEGRIAGFITYFVINPERGLGEIGNNAVHPDYQGRSLGRKQYDRVLEELLARGVDIVQVTTGLDDAHAPARRAYEAAGFEKQLPKVTYVKKIGEHRSIGACRESSDSNGLTWRMTMAGGGI